MDLMDLLITVAIDDRASKQVDSTSSNIVSKLSGAASAAQSAVSKIGSALSGVYDGAQVAVGGLVGTVGTLAATGGISRALNIEAAKAKLTGLGHTGDELTAIMANCSAAVTGTSYGLGEAATAAGVLAAAGVEAGDGLNDMQGVLSTVASVATVSGREFGEIASIFGKVASYGKLTTETMQQLMDSGIPVLAMLSEHFGVTTEEMQSMVTAGEVSFQEFNEVMSENMGNAAQVCGQTFPAALKNLKAALSKIGAAAATPALESLRQIILALNKVVNDFVPLATSMGDTLSQKLAEPTQKVVDRLTGLHESLQNGLSADFGGITPAVAAAGAAFLAFSSGGIATLLSQIPVLGGLLESFSGIIGAIGSPIGVAATSLIALGVSTGTLQEAFSPVVERVQALAAHFVELASGAQQAGDAAQLQASGLSILQSAFGAVAAVAQGLISVIWQVADAAANSGIGSAFQGLASVVAATMGGVETVVSGVMDVITAFFAGIAEQAPSLQGAFDSLGGYMESFAGNMQPVIELLDTVAQAVAPVVFALGSTLVQAFASVVSVASSVMNAFGEVAGAIAGSGIGEAIQGISDFLSPIVEGIGSVFSAVMGNIQAFFDGFTEKVGEAQPVFDLLGEAFSALGEAFSALGEALQPVIEAFTSALEAMQPVYEFVGGVLATAFNLLITVLALVVENFANVVQTIADFVSFITGVPDSVSTFVASVGAFFGQLPGLIGGFLGSVISSVASWVGSMVSNAASAGSGFVSGVVGFVTGLPGTIAGFLSSIIGNVASWVGQMASGAINAASQFASGLVNGLASLPGQMLSIGQNIIQGLINGITSFAGNVVSAITGTVGGAIDAAKSMLGIASPSKLFKQFGRYIDEGLALGIEGDGDKPVRAMSSVVSDVSGAATVTASAGSSKKAGVFATGAAGGGSVVEWLSENLPGIIEDHTPVMGENEFGRSVRKAVAYA